MTIAEGTQFGPYRLLEKIGAGGMGEVYRVLDTRLEREVALKLVSDSYLVADAGSGSPSPLQAHDTPAHATPQSGSHVSHERFLREARSAATLNHPNVCAIYDTGEQDGRPYLVMELLRGETLKRYLAKAGGKGLPAEEVVAFAQQAAAALAAAHAKGIIHRDIKPANLFVVDALGASTKSRSSTLGWRRSRPVWRPSTRVRYGIPGSGSSDETAVGPGEATLELTSSRLGGGNGFVHVPGTGARWALGCPHRLVQPGHRYLRDGDREDALRRRLDGRCIRSPAARGSAAREHGESGYAEGSWMPSSPNYWPKM